MALAQHYGTMAVDWEQRVDFDRLRHASAWRARKGAAREIRNGRAAVL